ncbi:thioredoxin domain-containing protein, partial [Nostocoides japonicum]|uniref:thioredoxin domain-containing protein n=1 Tax=Nostocoides japonicum TaxID=99481 RepID=UPI00065B8345
MNRLASAMSPYLLQHADNPVDWWEWGPEAFAEARRRDVPVFLSVGYAACHWCHVMAHESFEDPEVARVLAEGYVAVKVDREERPDVDSVYMAATQALTGAGGWPMTCLLTPSGDPFFAGTYFPTPQLTALLANAASVWREDRARVLSSAGHIAARLREVVEAAGSRSAVDESALEAAVAQLRRTFDPAYAGFGGAPKFPPSMVLEQLLRHHVRTGSADALTMASETCEAMARSGMYDQLDGGFFRYAVDRAWIVPHFEKMLYDNALLARVYAHLHRLTGADWAARVAQETADFVVAGLGTPEGGFASALDADTDGVEGLTYVWTPDELVEALGPEDGAAVADLLSVTPEGTFERGTSTLRLLVDPPDPLWWKQIRGRLAEVRTGRPQPARDDKVVTSWNGLAVAALADVGALQARPDLVTAAEQAADFLLETHLVEGRLRRVSRAGAVGSATAVLDDHGNLVEGLLALHQATGEPRWLEWAERLLTVALEHFRDGAGGWHDTADDAEQLFARPAGQTDNAEPSGVSSIAGAVLTYAALTGSPTHRTAAEDA